MGEVATKLAPIYCEGHVALSDSDDDDVQPRPQDTVIIFDWDDTLLCSSAIHREQWTMPEIKKLEATAISILEAAIRLGETLIVTNGTTSWIQESCRKFLPGVLPILSRVTAVSARSKYENCYPDDPFMWKRAAFRDLLRTRSKEGVNLVVLGDQMPEMQAAQDSTSVIRGRALIKTVKFIVAPTVLELQGQLCRAEKGLARLVEDGRSMHQGLSKKRLSEDSNHLISCARGWRLTKKAAAWRKFNTIPWFA
jgi:hypothetical protein